MEISGKWGLALVIVFVFIALFFAEIAGAFIIAQFSLTVTDYWLTFIIGYLFVSTILKIVSEIIRAVISFFGLFL